MIELATIFGKARMRMNAILHGAMFECTLGTISEKGFPLAHIVQWSMSNTRPDEKDTLSPDIKEAVKFLELLLELDPRKRISARTALETDFLREGVETEDDEMDVL